MKEKLSHDHYQRELARSEARLTELRENGAGALSGYDINIAHAGNAEEALHTAKWLVGNHIKYFRGKLQEMGPQVKQQTLFEVDP